MRLYLGIFILAALAACSTPEKVHPWGPGGNVFWDRVTSDLDAHDGTRRQHDSFWSKVKAGW